MTSSSRYKYSSKITKRIWKHFWVPHDGINLAVDWSCLLSTICIPSGPSAHLSSAFILRSKPSTSPCVAESEGLTSVVPFSWINAFEIWPLRTWIKIVGGTARVSLKAYQLWTHNDGASHSSWSLASCVTLTKHVLLSTLGLRVIKSGNKTKQNKTKKNNQQLTLGYSCEG